MRLSTTELDTGQLTGLGEHGVAVGQARQCSRVEGGEGVKRIAFEVGAFCCGEQKGRVEGGVVANQDSAIAAMLADFLAYRTKNLGQCLGFRNGAAQRIVGIDAVEL